MLVVGSVFAGPDEKGDFAWMIEQPEFADGLFVFNDNEEQFEAHQLHQPGAGVCSAGGGNAVIRPWQCRVPQRACGVPTGSRGLGFLSLDAHTIGLIDRAVEQVQSVAEACGYERIFYSAATSGGTLGTGIFSVAPEVKDYIVTQLRALGGQE